MNTSAVRLIPVSESEFPFLRDDKYYKIYHDGGHFVGTLCLEKGRSVNKLCQKPSRMDKCIERLFYEALQSGIKKSNLCSWLKTRLISEYPHYSDIEQYVLKNVKRLFRNLSARKKRFKRKAYLNQWNYFVSFTFSDDKCSEEIFRRKLLKCLSNFHTRRGWRYMGVFERGENNDRLHFHGLFYIPQGQMVGNVCEKKDYSLKLGKMVTRHENDFFEKTFGRNDFDEVTEMELKHGNAINYILKYIGKSNERIVYSRGIATDIICAVNENDIVSVYNDFVQKYVFFDNVFSRVRNEIIYRGKRILSVA